MKRILAGMLIVLTVIIFSSCGEPNVIGDWYRAGQDEPGFELTKDNVFIPKADADYQGTYKIDGNTIIVEQGQTTFSLSIDEEDGKTVLKDPESDSRVYYHQDDIKS